jgi:predicted phosphodiesterase
LALRGVDQEAEVLLLAGDLTDHGTPDEAAWLAEQLSQIKMEKVAVFGNHDYESGQQDMVRQKLGEVGVHVLDGEPWALNDLGVAGVKGFAGGFDHAQLQRFGEDVLKTFVDASIQEELNLAFHGHAHRGVLRGATPSVIPVFNVALPVLRRLDKPVGYLTVDL